MQHVRFTTSADPSYVLEAVGFLLVLTVCLKQARYTALWLISTLRAFCPRPSFSRNTVVELCRLPHGQSFF